MESFIANKPFFIQTPFLPNSKRKIPYSFMVSKNKFVISMRGVREQLFRSNSRTPEFRAWLE